MGALVAMDGGLYRTQPIYNSMALVKVGEIKGVPVYNNNMLIGYTDSKGADEYNLNLSEQRANAVKSYLAGKGLSNSRFSILGMPFFSYVN